MVGDRIADMLTRIRNASQMKYDTVEVLGSKMTLGIAEILKNEGYIEDFMFARKVISKLEGRFDDYIKPGLLGLKDLISKTYGANSFAQTNHLIDKLLRKL